MVDEMISILTLLMLIPTMDGILVAVLMLIWGSHHHHKPPCIIVIIYLKSKRDKPRLPTAKLHKQ